MINIEKKLILHSFIPDILSAFLIFLYSVFSLKLSAEIVQQLLFRLFFLVIILQFIIAPLTDHMVYKKTSDEVNEFQKEKTDIHQRTELLEHILRLPYYTALMVFAYFFIGSLYLVSLLYIEFKVSASLCVLFVIEMIFGSFFAAFAGYNTSFRICSNTACDIVSKGVEVSYVMEKKFFGLSVQTQIFMYTILPTFLILFINAAVVIIGYIPSEGIIMESSATQLSRMTYTCVLNTITLIICVLFFYFSIKQSTQRMTEALEEMSSSDFSETNLIRTDINDEFAHNHFLTNQMIDMFTDLLEQTKDFATLITKSTNELNKISSSTEATSVEQSTGTREIVSTMEGTTNLSHDIEKRIEEVTYLAKETVENVQNGSNLLEKALESVRSIENSNQDTIAGIRDLNEKINSIGEIATLIDSISDQTKIIAFNAELEATTQIGEKKNFKNVSSEIRRLANSTIDSTAKIKRRIQEIQNASQALIRKSHESTDNIAKEKMLASQLDEKFQNIRNSATSNSSSANEIQYLVEQQTSAFDQIVKTLQQISLSIQNFSMSTRTLIDTSRNLQTNVEQLESLGLSLNSKGAEND